LVGILISVKQKKIQNVENADKKTQGCQTS